ncbi:angiotensin-converting enzyme [Aplysia californica]|uniref:Angiotensin-converting enzyme n=1 Tax=Aplysia californica TaxID=6500 RepID=A0ABM1AB63_APLCA|nr:angiotensin-converting enzyme [Aplysia californica]
MDGLRFLVLSALVLSASVCHGASLNTNETEAQQFLDDYNAAAIDDYYISSEASWALDTNITEYNTQKMIEAEAKSANFSRKMAQEAAKFDVSKMSEDIQRQFRFLKDVGTAAQTNITKSARLTNVSAQLESIYAKAKVCLSSDNCVSLEPDLTRIMAKSRNYTELTTVWKKWRDVSGKVMPQLYSEYVDLNNDAVKLLGYEDAGVYWKYAYDTPTFENDTKRLYEEIRPLYQLLHAFAKKRLKEVFGAERFPSAGHIPAHLLGNMWAQEWNERIDILKPFKDKDSMDVTEELKRQNYSVDKMFRTSESFYKSLGLIGMPASFWNKSMLVRPDDGRDVVCHASAWDFYKDSDVRIKMCTDVTHEDLMTIHHEMGHIQYYLQYQNQSVLFRTGANPGFHEAVGDVMALSVGTPEHLRTIGLYKNQDNDEETDLNFLLNMALQKVAFLPFGYLIDQWRWSVFRGDTTPESYNEDWWSLRCKYQGVSPPVRRQDTDFDPGAKYHVASGTPYIRYFVSHILQFQFHKAACDAAGYKGPLHHCDTYNNKDAGTLFHNMLSMGASKPWQEAMEVMTGQRNMSAEPLMEYFKPLIDYLKKETTGENLEWTDDCPQEDYHEQMDQLDDVEDFLSNYNEGALTVYNQAMEAEWAKKTNGTEENEKEMVRRQVRKAKFRQRSYKQAAKFDDVKVTPDMRRQLNKIKDIGASALRNETKLERLQSIISDMGSIYSAAKPCLSNGECMLIEPGLTRTMTESHDYDLLLSAWKGWRDETGAKMVDLYREYVALKNEGVRELNFPNYGAYWRSWYDTDDPDYRFEDDVFQLLRQVQPLYEQLHAYVRRHLRTKFGDDKMPTTGHIPAHLLGNMWGQTWDTLYGELAPFKNKKPVDVTAEMIKKNYTVHTIFESAEGFFKSIGMLPMTDIFWNKSMTERPKDGRIVDCHGSAEDFYKKDDFRIKMCTEITQESFNTVHHEMGHIEYFMLYADKPLVYRDSANPGFHEAVGDLISLSAQTPEHLVKVGLLDPNYKADNETDLNFQMNMALQKIAFLPFGYLIDQWRWGVFSGEIPPEKYNEEWWNLRCRLQGIAPPVLRKSTDFDPGAKYHIPNDVPYIRYFVSFIIQFQFQKAACEAAGHTGPLHHCDIYQNAEAGRRIRSMLELGSSRPWPDALEQLTGSRRVDASALLEYFQPLHDYLRKENGNDYGWDPICPRSVQRKTSSCSACKKCPPGTAGIKPSITYQEVLILSLVSLIIGSYLCDSRN